MDLAQVSSENGVVFGAAWISALAAGEAAEARPVGGVIDAIVEQDKACPAKQRHTAKQVFDRLREEHQFPGGYTIVLDIDTHTDANVILKRQRSEDEDDLITKAFGSLGRRAKG